MARIPHGYHDLPELQRDLAAGGFTVPPRITTLAARSRADTPRIPAYGYCRGTPLRNEIEANGPGLQEEAVALVTDAIALRFGPGPVEGKIQAHIAEVER